MLTATEKGGKVHLKFSVPITKGNFTKNESFLDVKAKFCSHYEDYNVK